jgi:hypothetical protein
MSASANALANQLEAKFPGGANEIKILGASAPHVELANVRKGKKKLADLGWIPSENAEILDKRLELANAEKFDRTKKEDREELSRMIAESYQDEQRAKELNAYRVFELTNDVLASTFALSAFQSVNLSADELPMIKRPQSFLYNKFTVRSIGQDGGAKQDQWRTTGAAQTMEVELISTDKIEYPLYDIQTGNIEVFDDINRKLQYDLEMYIDKLAQDNIDAAKMTSGLRDLLNIHPLIDATNIPDTNYLDLNTLYPGNAKKLTIQKLKHILNHIAMFGSVGGADEQFSLSSIILSPQNIRDPWDFTDLVFPTNPTSATRDVEPSGTIPTPTRESIYNTGMFTSAWGFNFNWMPNPRIAKGRMYAMTNRPIGWLFTKTEFDKVLRWEGPDQVEYNYGQVLMQRCLKFVMPDLWRSRILIIDL